MNLDSAAKLILGIQAASLVAIALYACVVFRRGHIRQRDSAKIIKELLRLYRAGHSAEKEHVELEREVRLFLARPGRPSRKEFELGVALLHLLREDKRSATEEARVESLLASALEMPEG